MVVRWRITLDEEDKTRIFIYSNVILWVEWFEMSSITYVTRKLFEIHTIIVLFVHNMQINKYLSICRK